MQNRIFFPQAALDSWFDAGRIDIQADELLMREEGRRYRLVEAFHVLRELTGTPDSEDLVGKVKTRAFCLELGAEIAADSMLLGDNAFDVVPGFLAFPVGTFEEHRNSLPHPQVRLAYDSDEELLASFITSKL